MKLLLAIFTLFTIKTFAQGKIDGFYRGKGNLTTVLGFGFEDYKNYFAGREKLDLGRTVVYGNIFASYGITENLDAQVALPYIASGNNKNFQDVSVFLKYRFLTFQNEKNKLELSFGSGISTPVSDYKLGGLNDIGQQATIIDTRLLVHYQWNYNWFITAQSGYSFKSDPTPNSIPFTLKLGTSQNSWYYDVYYDYQHSIGGIDYRGTPFPQDFRALGSDFNKVGGTVFKSITDKFGAYTSISYLISGRNTFQGAAFGVGLTYDFKKTDK
jgi:hypothetical protein